MSSFRQLLADGQDEQVSVNQRALVEKILARSAGSSGPSLTKRADVKPVDAQVQRRVYRVP